MKDNRIKGRPASPGYAVGRIHLLDVLTGAGAHVYPDPEGDPAAAAAAEPAVRDPALESAVLAKALAVAVDEMRALIASLGAAGTRNDDAVGILGFQLALLQDDALTAPALQSIAAGRPAVEAWRSALNDQIRWYQTAEDEYFRARASDLASLRRARDVKQRRA